jgi:hypothetical protein
MEPNFTIVTQNIRGTQGSKNLQGHITNLGIIDNYLLQETWIYEDIETEIQGITFINHGMQKGTNNGGVAILLNKRAQKACNVAGRPELYKSNTLAGDNTRFLMIELLLLRKKINKNLCRVDLRTKIRYHGERSSSSYSLSPITC